jgi:hypothetical protein
MNGAHLHLLVNHIPLFGIAFGLLVLVWSLIKKSQDLELGAILLFTIGGISAWIADQTGDSAEDIAEKLPEVTKQLIHAHEEVAEFAVIAATAVAGIAIALFLARKSKNSLTPILRIVLLLTALGASAAMARTAYLGGMIRHTEIRDGSAATQPATSSGEIDQD